MTKVLDESVWDNLSIEFESGHSVEFASFSHTNGVLYNIAGINEESLGTLEQNVDLKIDSKGDVYITFNREDTASVEIYWEEIENILAAMGSGRDGIPAMELKNLN
jgi:hypothetical protein